MQEQYDKKAREHAIKQKEVCCLYLSFVRLCNIYLSLIAQKEEILRQEKLKNLEKYGTKLGRSSKTLTAGSSDNQLQQTVLKKKSEKPKLKPGK